MMPRPRNPTRGAAADISTRGSDADAFVARGGVGVRRRIGVKRAAIEWANQCPNFRDCSGVHETSRKSRLALRIDKPSSSSELVARLTAPQASLAAASAPKSAPRCSPRRTQAPGLSLWWSRVADRRGRGALRRRDGDVISRLQRWLARRGENICEPPSPPSRRTRAPYPLSRPRRRGSTRRPSRGSAPTPRASRASSSEPPRRSHTSTTPAHRSRRNASSTRSSSTSSARPSRAATRPSRSAPRTSCALTTPSPTCSTASRPRSPSGRAPRPCGKRRLDVSSFTRAIASSPLEPSTPATPSPTFRPVNVRVRSWSSSRATSAGSSTRRSSNG